MCQEEWRSRNRRPPDFVVNLLLTLAIPGIIIANCILTIDDDDDGEQFSSVLVVVHIVS